MLLGVRSKLSHGPRSRFKRAVPQPNAYDVNDSKEVKVQYVYGMCWIHSYVSFNTKISILGIITNNT